MLFLIVGLYKYFKNYKFHFIFLNLYILVAFFAFFSGDSHFNIPIFSFLSIIPFFTDYLVKLNRANQISK